MGEDKHWATSYLLDPLTAPQPSDETGLGTHFTSTYAPTHGDYSPPSAILQDDKGSKTRSEARVLRKSTGDSRNPCRRTASESSEPGSGSGIYARPVSIRPKDAYPTPPASASPNRDRFSLSRAEPSKQYDDSPSAGKAKASAGTGTGNRRRGSSLTERFPGDKSHRPLEMIKRDTKLANRSPHLQKQSIPGADTIDRLDGIGGRYHHEGPYDAALYARNMSPLTSPVAAVASTNEEALKATPKEYILDAINGHRPLDGTAIVPPGMPDRFGRVYDYEEGTDMMRENGGNYKRWPGVTYLPEDLKGKGEPSFTIERALKNHPRSGSADGLHGIEMTNRSPQQVVYNDPDDSPSRHHRVSYSEHDMHRRNSTGKRLSDGLRRRIGSLRKR